MSGRGGAEGLSSRFARLSALDLMFLRVESAAWPCHFGGLAVLDGGTLLDPSGRLRLGEIADRLSLWGAKTALAASDLQLPEAAGGSTGREAGLRSMRGTR